MKTEILNKMKEMLKNAGYENAEHLTMGSNITEAGITSLMYIQVIVELELFYDIEINPDYMFVESEDSIQKIVDEVAAKLDQKNE